ncbi:hypothetical protein N656DRAFT_775970 [Canariomyces notabilis]|uniref:Secreted protein n=1 Tax=Canariomyces notabilis TaxID=2074819 RepID=A0AAN6YW53_9PEZI|nr:hypothetical protein N656DRAFT_775970 [Canariomyces arenarius]
MKIASSIQWLLCLGVTNMNLAIAAPIHTDDMDTSPNPAHHQPEKRQGFYALDCETRRAFELCNSTTTCPGGYYPTNRQIPTCEILCSCHWIYQCGNFGCKTATEDKTDGTETEASEPTEALSK